MKGVGGGTNGVCGAAKNGGGAGEKAGPGACWNAKGAISGGPYASQQKGDITRVTEGGGGGGGGSAGAGAWGACIPNIVRCSAMRRPL